MVRLHPIPQTSNRLDNRCAELPPQSRNKHFNRVGIAIEALRVDVFGQFALRNHTAAMMHEIREHAEFVTGETDRNSVECHSCHARVERYCATTQFRMSSSACAPDQSAEPGEQFFHAKRLGHVIIRATVNALNFFMPASS